jgi:hypothetical protein
VEHPHPLSALLDTSLASHLEFDPSLNRITPVPSQILTVYNNNQPLNITLDSGATVSFIRLAVAIEHNFTIQPNQQLALLADEKTRLAALGEIDVTLTRANFSVRLRALVVKNLQSACFGGTNFHLENDIEPRIKTGQIKIHNKFIVLQTNPVLPLPTCLHTTATATLSASIQEASPNPAPIAGHCISTQPPSPVNRPAVPAECPPTPIVIRRTVSILPQSSTEIPLPTSIANKPTISIQPLHLSNSGLTPQICPVQNGTATICNHSNLPVVLPAKTQLLAVGVQLRATKDLETAPLPASHRLLPPPPLATSLPAIQVNTQGLSASQITRLESIHKANASVFDPDLSTGYNHKSGKYYANLRFKEDSRPEAKTLDVPQYNRQCANLQQALMDRLEQQNVLVNPHDHGIEVKSVSPSWVIQKGSAKTKALKDCTIDELRWVVAFNNLNNHLLPKPAKVSSLTKAVKFLARWKYHILADLHNSYFQIHVARKYWCWLGVMTPHRGLRVLTRLGQGLLNSEGELDELLAIVLGDLITQGICEIARDDIQVGGNTYDEAIANWDTVLTRLSSNGLKVSPKKVRIFPASTEVYGVKLQNGKISPSDHVLTTLGITSIDQLKSVKNVNAWRGLYKTLLHNLPHLSDYMHPFDVATANKASRDPFCWTPELTAAFNAAQSHLKNAHSLALPAPHEQLVLQPDGAQRPPAIGWVLSVIRQIEGKPQLLPVQFCSAKLRPHMQFWTPCEIEAVATFIAVEQCSPWIMEATIPTYVCPDSKAVVQAANRMSQGKMSTNPRLQNLLACINRRPVLFHHSSAKLGQHLLSDTCSRTPTSCSVQDCAIERFLDDLPEKINLMASDIFDPETSTATDLLSQDCVPSVTAAASQDLLSFLSSPSSALPLGSYDTWRAIQEGDPDSAVVLHCKKSGDTPRKKATNPAINRFFAAAQVKNGVLVVPTLDNKMMRTIDRVVVPSSYIPTLLTIIHLKCNHPSRYQMEQIFQRYFFAPPGLESRLTTLYEQCYTCQSMTRLRPTSSMAPPSSPDHPGTHMQADVMKRCGQLILVNMDLFSNYTTAAFIPSERKEDLLHGLIQVTTPIRRGELLLIRTDRAPALEALAKSPPHEMKSVNIQLVLPDAHFNKNSNAKVDKIIQELQLEIRKICPEQRVLSVSELARATCNLNNRIRKSGLTASEIQFSRDFSDGSNIPLRDETIKEQNTLDRTRSLAQQAVPPPKPGDMVLIPCTADKHAAPTPYLVTQPGPSSSSLRKLLHSGPDTSPPVKLSSRPVTAKNSDMIRLKPLIPAYSPQKNPSKHRGPSSEPPQEALRDTPNRPPENQWDPLHHPELSDSDSDDVVETFSPHPSHYLPPSDLPPAVRQAHLLLQTRQIAATSRFNSNILPALQALFEANRQATIQTRAMEPRGDQPTPRDHQPPPVPARQAKLQALQRLVTRPIPQLEGAEITPDISPETSFHPASPFLQPHPLSPQDPWSPSSSERQPSLDWDHTDDTPSFNLFGPGLHLLEKCPASPLRPHPWLPSGLYPIDRRWSFGGISQPRYATRLPKVHPDYSIWNQQPYGASKP